MTERDPQTQDPPSSEGRDGLIGEPTRRALEQIGTVDIVVALPARQAAEATDDPAGVVGAGIAESFPGIKAVIVTPIDRPPGEMPETMHAEGGHGLHRLLLPRSASDAFGGVSRYAAGPGKGDAFREIFLIGDLLRAKACAIIDPDPADNTGERIELLIRPVFEERFDYVAPLYLRHKYDGTITTSILYPLTRALYGPRIRQPVGADFGFSGHLASHCLASAPWNTDMTRYGIDLWMTTTALAGGYRVCQAFLGAKPREITGHRLDLSLLLRQAVGCLFSLMETHETEWLAVTATAPVPTFGKEVPVGLDPIEIDVERMMKAMRQGVKDLLPLWEQVLAEETLNELYQVAGSMGEAFRFPDEVWVRVIYDFALGHHYRVLHRDHLLAALTPIYLGRVASFVLETQESDAADIERRIERLCRRFEAMKHYLVAQWR